MAIGMETALPQHASVVVIGGGIMGCSTIYHLANQGVNDAILLEGNELTSGTTWHSAAQVRALRSTQNLTNLIRYSISLYAELEKETGQATGWINKGSLSIATSQDRLTHIKRQEVLAHAFGVRAESISANQAKERWPLMNTKDVIGAVWSPDDGRVSPSDLCAALVKGARSRGTKLFEHTAVTGIETQNGKVTGVETTKGRVACDAIALCTGLWSRKMASMANVSIPVWPCEHFYLLTKPVSGIEGNLPTLSDHDAHLYIRDDSGGLLIGCFEPMGKPIDPDRLGEDFSFQLLPEDWDHFEPMMSYAMHRLPVLEQAEVKILLNGPESFTPDGSFMLGESAETGGFFLGCGMNSVGVATGGGAGMALAHCIVYGHTPTGLHEADPKRFPACFQSVDALTARVPEVLGKHYEITYPGRQMDSARQLRTTPLHHKLQDARAHFGQFYGWERPLYFNCRRTPTLSFDKPEWFDQVATEVKQAHTQAAVFDQSTFGKIRVEGADAESFLNRICANNMARTPGCVIYTAMLNERGGIESDLAALRLNDDSYRLYTGTAAIKRDMTWLRRQIKSSETVAFTDETESYAVIGLMGPAVPDIAHAIGASGLNRLKYFQHGKIEIENIPVRAARLSYVGEAGWEITCHANHAVALYEKLFNANARPAGVFAQTSMRIEKRFLAYGHDLDTDITPLEAGLDFAVDWDKDFVGRDALLRRRDVGIKSRIVTLILNDIEAVPLGNEPIYRGHEIIGKTTSAAFGYRIGKPLALGYISVDENDEIIEESESLQINIAGTKFSADASLRAVFDPAGLRMKSKL